MSIQIAQVSKRIFIATVFAFGLASSSTFLSFGSNLVMAQSIWQEEAITRGVTYLTPYGNWDAQGTGFGFGIALNDFDGDDDLDLILTGATNGQISVFANNGSGQFTDQTLTSGLPADLYLGGLSAADYDGDGDLDLFISGWGVPNQLYQNNGNLNFSDVTSFAGMGDPGLGCGSCWGDYDGDSHLDLYVTNRTGTYGSTLPNLLYRNLGNGSFEEVAASMGVDDIGYGLQAIWFDHDQDADLDLYLSNDKGNSTVGNRLWRNDGGILVDISVVSGADVRIDSMGICAGDLDRNGYFDLYCANVPTGNKLLMNQGNDTYIEDAFALGAAVNLSCWGTIFLDYDNDAELDLFVSTSISGDQLLRNTGTFPLQNVSASTGLDAYSDSYGSVSGDIDGDGDLDLIVQRYNENVAIYINPNSTNNNWLKIKCEGSLANTFGVGSTAKVTINGESQYRQVYAGSSYKCSEPQIMHFGLGAATTIDEVEIKWLGGQTTTLNSVAVNQTLIVQEPMPTEDCNQNSIPDHIEITMPGTDLDNNGILDSCDIQFIRGDVSGDLSVGITDVIIALDFIFSGGTVGCKDAVDVSNDGLINIADVINLLGYLFLAGANPAAPFPTCGVDQVEDGAVILDCQTSSCP